MGVRAPTVRHVLQRHEVCARRDGPNGCFRIGTRQIMLKYKNTNTFSLWKNPFQEERPFRVTDLRDLLELTTT